ncbi:UDP-glucose--dolichyl-phosphate glucosyltransferase [Hymenobacter amundsenii]|uniref:UDP-glucose--dolichyl-phosphate glucosyltransferase n=1 Tax=Hymenobacter amundsenii TaxID=2006685 RepID=A0A2D0AFW5_9BACT|nr:glycosyltransferase family 2 protein [Hymenobacter amundsenii]OWP63257.1 UDP-glucose--dolichyl-phosphate glucosyltransferase [Hymenobacter amundsenii]
MVIDIIIPAFNEERSIASVLAEIPAELVREVIVVDNNSSDQTGAVAAAAGATVLREPRPGYGHACLAGMAHCFARPAAEQADIIVFLDGDYSDYPADMTALVQPIVRGEADLVIGSRALGEREAGSMLPQQIYGNWLATTLLRWFYGARFTDLGPFRAIRREALQRIGMRDTTYGWTVEMQLKAAKLKLRSVEVPVRYRRRIGVSKVSGTVKGTLGAGYKILWTIFRYL